MDTIKCCNHLSEMRTDLLGFVLRCNNIIVITVILFQGVEFQIKGKKQIFRGCVLLMLADMLAAHSIGGFKVGVGFSFRKCRDCLATKQTMNKFVRIYIHTLHVLHMYM